jgi:hypothetical protein
LLFPISNPGRKAGRFFPHPPIFHFLSVTKFTIPAFRKYQEFNFTLKRNKMKKFILLLATGLSFLSCEKEAVKSQNIEAANLQLAKGAAQSSSTGAIQVSGVGFYPTLSECPLPQGATYALKVTGDDLNGCLFVTVTDFSCTPSGAYRESGTEHFVGTYNGGEGSFDTAYKFEGKYEGCPTSGTPLGAEILGRCQHPIVEGSGESVFYGVSGRLDFRDVLEGDGAPYFPYRGHFRF